MPGEPQLSEEKATLRHVSRTLDQKEFRTEQSFPLMWLKEQRGGEYTDLSGKML